LGPTINITSILRERVWKQLGLSYYRGHGLRMINCRKVLLSEKDFEMVSAKTEVFYLIAG
jgi:hypothetical protein